MTVSLVAWSLARTIATTSVLLEPVKEAIDVVQYKRSVDKNTHMTRRKELKENEKSHLKHDCKSWIYLPDKYDEYYKYFLSMRCTLESMLNDHHWQTNTPKLCIELV